MRILPFTYCVSLLLSVFAVSYAQANEVVTLLQSGRAGVILNNTRLYADSTFAKPLERTLSAGTLVEVLAGTRRTHLDDAQKQRFRWLRIQSVGGGEAAWVFGDAMAIMQTGDVIDEPLRPIHLQNASFGTGFEDATVWAASLEGRDAIHDEDYLNAAYRETYLVVTNAQGRSVLMNCGGLSAMGKSGLQSAAMTDLTGDNQPEIVFEHIIRSEENNVMERELEVFAFQGGGVAKLLDERLTLSIDKFTPAPSLSKSVEASNGAIRFAYLDFGTCTEATARKQERCLAYITYTYAWDAHSRSFKMLYPETRVAIKGTMRDGMVLLKEPGVWGVSGKVVKDEEVEVLRFFERYASQNGKTVAECYLLVRNQKGEAGYIAAENVQLGQYEHSEIFEQYMKQPPVVKSEWTWAHPFVKVE